MVTNFPCCFRGIPNILQVEKNGKASRCIEPATGYMKMAFSKVNKLSLLLF